MSPPQRPRVLYAEIPDELDALLDRLVQDTGRTRTALITEAVVCYLRQQGRIVPTFTPKRRGRPRRQP